MTSYPLYLCWILHLLLLTCPCTCGSVTDDGPDAWAATRAALGAPSASSTTTRHDQVSMGESTHGILSCGGVCMSRMCPDVLERLRPLSCFSASASHPSRAAHHHHHGGVLPAAAAGGGIRQHAAVRADAAVPADAAAGAVVSRRGGRRLAREHTVAPLAGRFSRCL